MYKARDAFDLNHPDLNVQSVVLVVNICPNFKFSKKSQEISKMTKFVAFSPGGSGRMTQTSIKVFFERKLKEVNSDDVSDIPLAPPATAASAAKPALKTGSAAATADDKENNEDDGVIVITSDNDDDGEIDLAKKKSSGGCEERSASGNVVIGIVGKKRKSAAMEKVNKFEVATAIIIDATLHFPSVKCQ